MDGIEQGISNYEVEIASSAYGGLAMTLFRIDSSALRPCSGQAVLGMTPLETGEKASNGAGIRGQGAEDGGQRTDCVAVPATAKRRRNKFVGTFAIYKSRLTIYYRRWRRDDGLRRRAGDC